ncbi:MAG: DJ-1/PfpI family protein [Lachnospiraceae bacterium]|nr:DJ-1/PfpI family protein [Lachnospiraceae bacterium]
MTKVGVFLADGFEEIEGLTAVDAMRRAGYQVTTISIMEKTLINGSHGIRVYADCSFDDAEFDSYDCIILPGGLRGTQNLAAHEGVCAKVKEFVDAGRVVGAICAAPTVLAAAGVLSGKHATCYPGCEAQFPDDVIYTGAQVEQEDRIITGNGMAAALPFALAVIREVSGEEDVVKVKNGVAYPN